MRLIGKLVVIIIILGLLLGASAYVLIYTDDENNTGNDTEPPKITDISGHMTVTAGKTATITVVFSDNVNVTKATLYYKSAELESWTSVSILSGNADIVIPSGSTSNYYYYITVDDAAGNGPVGDPSTNGSLYYTITVNTGDEEIVHTVFVEEATATWCTNCPNVANILYTLYESQNYNFYYVALINDTNPIARNRNWKEYNVYGYPTVFIDGGYKVIVGANNPESTYINAITAAQQRTMPKVKVTVTSEYQNTTKEVTVNTLIENKEDAVYDGTVKLYLTEIISHVADYESKPYHFGFLEYLTDEKISVNSKQNLTLTETKDISTYDYENLMIIAVVFNSEKHQGYANPDNKTQNLFDAYYVDATDAVKIVEGGNLPPQLTITSPQKGKIYLNGKSILERLSERKILGTIFHTMTYNITLLYLKKTITVNASDDSAVTKVEFYIDGILQYNDTTAPYEWTFSKISKIRSLRMKTHVLDVVVYDDTGKKNSARLNFKARI